MYSALKQSVPQKPNNWLPVRTFKKPKANKLATGPQSVKHSPYFLNNPINIRIKLYIQECTELEHLRIHITSIKSGTISI
jgi:hypothetical protein